MTRLKILSVCDSQPFLRLIEDLASASCHQFQVVAHRSLNADLLSDPTIALVVAVASKLTPTEEYVELMEACNKAKPRVPVIVLTEDSSPRKMIQWLRAGAADCLSAPADRDRLLFLFESLTLDKRATSVQLAQQGHWIGDRPDERVCCASPQTAALIAQINQLAPQHSNVMLIGETGTGKTRLAKYLHEASPRRHEPFVAVNCAAMPTTLLESELFGHRRGAFTGADSNHTGKFSHVGSGTLLLDEVDTLSLEAQAKLLRTVDNRVFEPLGSNKSEKFRGRLVVATNQNLLACVERGEFRADLYYRLNVVELMVPPLRERKQEILEISEACIAQYAAQNGTKPKRLSPEVREFFEDYSWPGNVRELQNVVERAMTFSQGSTIRLVDLPQYILGIRTQKGEDAPSSCVDALPPVRHAPATDSSTLAQARADGERYRLIEVLKRHNQNRSEAARELGISRTALYKRLKKHELVDFSFS